MDWYDWSSFAHQLLLRIADASVRAVALAVMAGVLTLFLRRRSAAQHAMWTLVVIGMLALPVMRPFVPAAYVYSLPRTGPVVVTMRPAAQLTANPGIASAPPPSLQTQLTVFRLGWPVYAAIAYITGIALFAALLMAGLFLTRRLLRRARSTGSELWRFHDLVADAGVDVQVEESNHVRVPVTVGLKRRRVLLPAEWREWPVEKLKLVLA